MVIALLALFATILVTGSARMLDMQPVTSEEVFWKAVQEARKRALKAEHEMRLQFDDRKKQFAIYDGMAPGLAETNNSLSIEEVTPVATFPLVRGAENLNIDFLGASVGHRIIVAGTVVESQTVPFVTFYSDGTCSPFRVQFRRSSGADGASVLAVDPWTCAPMLKLSDDANRL